MRFLIALLALGGLFGAAPARGVNTIDAAGDIVVGRAHNDFYDAINLRRERGGGAIILPAWPKASYVVDPLMLPESELQLIKDRGIVLDCGGLDGLEIRGAGPLWSRVLFRNCDDWVAFGFIAAKGVRLNGFAVYTWDEIDKAARQRKRLHAARVGILFGRRDAQVGADWIAPDAGGHILRDLQLWGDFRVGGVVNISSERNVFERVTIEQQADHPCLIVSNMDFYDLPLETDGKAGAQHTMTGAVFRDCEFTLRKDVKPTSCAVLIESGAMAIDFWSCGGSVGPGGCVFRFVGHHTETTGKLGVPTRVMILGGWYEAGYEHFARFETYRTFEATGKIRDRLCAEDILIDVAPTSRAIQLWHGGKTPGLRVR